MNTLRCAVVVSAMLASSGALAQSVCAKHEDFTKFLENQHQEVVAAIGLAGQGTLVEIFVSKEGSWTIAATNTEGVSCMVMAGEHFEMIDMREKAARAIRSSTHGGR